MGGDSAGVLRDGQLQTDFAAAPAVVAVLPVADGREQAVLHVLGSARRRYAQAPAHRREAGYEVLSLLQKITGLKTF